MRLNYCFQYGFALLVQGDQNQNLLLQMAMILKICISDPIFVKPKCVWHAQVFSKTFKQTAEKLECILALPTWGQKCILMELQSFEVANFDLDHPVCTNAH